MVDLPVLWWYSENMDTIQAAQKVLGDAEDSLNKLIEKALAEQRYEDIKGLANLADGIARLTRGEMPNPEPPLRTLDPSPQYRVSEPPYRPPTAARAKTKRRASRKSQYPRFERDGDRLVKIGWSKKNKKEYEHRVLRAAARTFVFHLADKAINGAVFDVEGLLPVIDISGDEVPAYQVYLILAWLRDSGLLEKKGRDGYLVRDKELLRGNFDELWNNLRTKES